MYPVSMISFEDCIALCGLTAQEVAAIAEHEHVPEVAAATLGQYLLKQEHGKEQICQMIIDDIRAALLAKNASHAARLVAALQHLLAVQGGCGSIHMEFGRGRP
jgi:hypothetical protein